MRTVDITEWLRARSHIANRMSDAAHEIERLRAALREYGDHTYECRMKDGYGCTCGYEFALRGDGDGLPAQPATEAEREVSRERTQQMKRAVDALTSNVGEK